MNEAQTDEFELVDEGVFMDEVRKYTCLYDTKQKCYKNKKTTKKNAWEQIAKKFNGTIEECEKR